VLPGGESRGFSLMSLTLYVEGEKSIRVLRIRSNL